jgi:Zn-dependent protease with chaperone function
LMGMLIGLAGDVNDFDFEEPRDLFGSLVIATALPLRIIAAASIARWIGTRSRPYVLAIVIGAFVLGTGAHFLASLMTVTKQPFKDLTPLSRFITLWPDMIFYLVFGALGFWFGQRQKLAYYLAFILKVLPPETRQTIVEMAQDEAKRARRPATQASP